MLDPNIKDKEGLPLTCRAVFIVGPDKKLKLSLNYPASVGRNMDEIVRVVDALQLSAKYSVVRARAFCLVYTYLHSRSLMLSRPQSGAFLLRLSSRFAATGRER